MFSLSRMSRALFVVGLLLLSGACVSRYRLDLNLSIADEQLNADIEEARYVAGVHIGDAQADSKLVIGSGNCIVITTSSRANSKSDQSRGAIMRLDENLRCKLYLELPDQLRAETVSLLEKSFVQILGRYEVPAAEKIYLVTGGQLVIDSLIDQKFLFGTIDGEYSNRSGAKLSYQGRFKVKLAN